MLILNDRELRCAYETLFILEQCGPELAHESQIESLKRNIRQYVKQNRAEEGKVILNEWDAALFLTPLPESLKTEEEAESYFKRNLYMEATPSQYDCTGQRFTAWYKLFRRRGRFWVFHQVCLDV